MEVLLFRTRLSIIACRDMVPHYYSGEPTKIPEIAEKYGFKPKSLNPSFSNLVKAGILNSRIGGTFEERGFTFTRDPKLITLYDIVKSVEGDDEVECCVDKLKCKPRKCKDCSIHEELQVVLEHRRRVLSATSIYEHFEKMNK